MEQLLALVNQQMTRLSINYEYMEYHQSPPKYPYWVGEFTDSPSSTEDGKSETIVILTGFQRGKHLPIIKDFNKIKKEYTEPQAVRNKQGSAFLISYEGGYPVPSGNDELIKYEIRLLVQAWKGD